MPSRFPHPPSFEFGGRAFSAAEVVARLAPFVAEERRARIAEVVAARAYDVVPVLVGLHDLGNVNAVLRSAEGLGYGAAHLAAPRGKAAAWAEAGEGDARGLRRGRRQSQGADKWLDVHVWPEAEDAARGLRALGFRIVAAHLDEAALPIEALDFTQPTALAFGNEHEGLPEAFLDLADATCRIPIDGFIQSYNVSVAAALGLYHARLSRIERRGRHGDLSPEEQHVLTAHYYLRSVRAAEMILARAARKSRKREERTARG